MLLSQELSGQPQLELVFMLLLLSCGSGLPAPRLVLPLVHERENQFIEQIISVDDGPDGNVDVALIVTSADIRNTNVGQGNATIAGRLGTRIGDVNRQRPIVDLPAGNHVLNTRGG